MDRSAEKVSNVMGLTGAEREAIAKKHTAFPCAPSVNPACGMRSITLAYTIGSQALTPHGRLSFWNDVIPCGIIGPSLGSIPLAILLV
jgi:hypothetical protein